MNALVAYLTFNGNCREAMTFYKACFGGELTFRMLGDMPQADGLPERMRRCVLEASLRNGDWLLMGSDMVSESGLIRGNAVSIMVECEHMEQIRDYHRKLTGASPAAPDDDTLFGDVTDPYGNHWLLNIKS